MNDQARKLLAFVIHHYGVDVIQTPKHLQALLKDHAKGQFKPEISLFMQAVTEGLVIKLLIHQYASVQSLSARAIKHLQEDCFIEKQAAHWVIDSWCIALKLARPIPIHTTPTPVAQVKPSPVAVIKSPVPPHTPVVQATPVPVIQGALVLYKVMRLLFCLFLFYLFLIVVTATGERQTKKETATGEQQTEESQRLINALGIHITGVHGTDPFNRELVTTSAAPGSLPGDIFQQVILGINNSGYQNYMTDPTVSPEFKDAHRKMVGHAPEPGLYNPDGTPSEKLKQDMARFQEYQEYIDIWRQGNTTDAKLSPDEVLQKATARLVDSDPKGFLDGRAAVLGLHQQYDMPITSSPPHMNKPPDDPRPLVAQILGGFIGASPTTAEHEYTTNAWVTGTAGGMTRDFLNHIQEKMTVPATPESDAELERYKKNFSEHDLESIKDMPSPQAITHLRNLSITRKDLAKLRDLTGTPSYLAQGSGVVKEDAQAVTWFRKAAEQGDTGAQRQLEKIKNQVAQKTQTTESLAQEPSQAQIASQPETQTQGVWTTDWGNDIIGLVTTEPCHVAELKNQGYVYALASSIPLARLKQNADAWKIVGDRAITVIGCWFKKDTNNTGLIHAKFKRKKDDKIWEDDLNLADGSWTFKRID